MEGEYWKMAVTGKSIEFPCAHDSCQRTDTRRCTGCKNTWYCSEEHQLADWKRHRKSCRRAQAKAEVLAELVRISEADPVMGEMRAVFITPDGDPVPAVVQMGERLNKAGGFRLMQEVGHAFLESVRDDKERYADVRDLDIAWDGIGEWRC